MTEITPDMLKEIAIAMGKEAKIDIEDNVWVYVGPMDNWNYIPHKNWNQCGEILEWLINEKGTPIELSLRGFIEPTVRIRQNLCGAGNLKEAIVLAFYEYIKEKTC